MPYQLEEINRRAHDGPAAFTAECDAAYQDRVRQAAQSIRQRRSESPVVLLSGPSGSGKTTTALKLE